MFCLQSRTTRMNNPLHIDLLPFIEKIKTFPISNDRGFDVLLFEMHQIAYDAYDYMLGDLPEKINEMKKKEAKEVIADLQALKKQVAPLMNILCNMNYDSKEMDRAKDFLGTIEEEIPKLIRKAKKNI